MKTALQSITPSELHDLLEKSPSLKLIDVRTPAEFGEVHATSAENVPLDQLKPADFAGNDAPLYLICKAGSRGATACERLRAAGCEQVVNVAGGTEAWDAAGLPVVRGKAVMSLERQVRIAAGLLVFGGALLATFVNPLWVWVSGFVGAGLVFAGVTDTCGMGMMLARMPWNRRVAACSTRG